MTLIARRWLNLLVEVTVFLLTVSVALNLQYGDEGCICSAIVWNNGLYL